MEQQKCVCCDFMANTTPAVFGTKLSSARGGGGGRAATAFLAGRRRGRAPRESQQSGSLAPRHYFAKNGLSLVREPETRCAPNILFDSISWLHACCEFWPHTLSPLAPMLICRPLANFADGRRNSWLGRVNGFPTLRWALRPPNFATHIDSSREQVMLRTYDSIREGTWLHTTPHFFANRRALQKILGCH